MELKKILRTVWDVEYLGLHMYKVPYL